MNTETHARGDADAPRQAQRRWTTRFVLLTILPRALLTVALVCVGLYTIGAYRRILRPAQAQPGAAAQDVPVSLPEVLLADVVEGGWVLSDSRWRLHVKRLTQREVSSWWNATLIEVPAVVEGDPELGAKVLPLLKRQGARREIVGELLEYRIEKDELRARVCYRRTAAPSLVSGRAIMRQGDHEWLGLEARFVGGQESTSKGQTNEAPWPLPQDSIVLAQRFGSHDSLLGQLVSAPLPPEALPEFWRLAGWRVAPVAGASSVGVHWQCERGGDRFMAWCYRESAEMPTLLFLLRTQAG